MKKNKIRKTVYRTEENLTLLTEIWLLCYWYFVCYDYNNLI